MKLERDMMRGAGPTAVLQLLSAGEMYGYEIVEQLEKRTQGVLAMGQSTLYPMLYNLEAKKLIEGDTRTADNGRARRYYKLTGSGRERLAADREKWSALASAMGHLGVLNGGSSTSLAGLA